MLDPGYGYALRVTAYSGTLLPTCSVLGFFEYYEDAEDELYARLADGCAGTFEIVQVRLGWGW